MTPEVAKLLGPLAPLAGIWEGDKGQDLAPDDDRTKVEKNLYRERITLEPFGPVNNHEQELWGLRHARVAFRLGVADSFHEEVGYWLWDAKTQQVLRMVQVPRGISILAGGTVAAEARAFTLAAELGSSTYGICSNEFLDREFKTVRYTIKVTVNGDGSFSYEEDTQLQIKGQKEIFHHVDKNTLKRLS